MTKTTVIFYKEEMPDSVLAVFPFEQSGSSTHMVCYSHVGQHSSCSGEYCTGLKKATKKQYADLKLELERYGYDLKII